MKYLHLIRAALLRRKTRTALTVLSVAAAFLLFGLLQSVNSVFSEVGDTIGAAHRLITMSKVGFMEPLPLALKSEIRAVPGVEAVAYESFFGATYQSPKNVIGGAVAVSRNLFALYPELKISAATARAFDRTQTGAIVGAALARRYHWKVGEEVPLKAMIYPRKSGSYAWTFQVVGLYHAHSALEEQDFLLRWRYLDRAAAFGRDTVGLYVEKIGDPAAAGAIAAHIDALTANSANPTRTQTDSAFTANLIGQYVNLGLLVHAVMGAVFFTLILLTGNTMAQAVRERIPELAVMKTLGFTNLTVLALVLAESVLLVALGGVIGLAAATAVVHVLQRQIGAQLPMAPVHGLIWLEGLAAMIVIGLVVGAFPARRGMRLRVIDALAGR
ncbi:MAG: ABC transporter permease [Pseudomonadota bacterium]|jgi:putative ABC transport system permease protein|nr:ABC transporter permease [Pseudomonadota bacterium]